MRHKIVSLLKLSYRLRIYYYIHRWIKDKRVDIALALPLLPFAFIKILWEMLTLNRRDNFEYSLGMAAIIKNEAPYIAEWIEYHRMLGFDKIVIYDNESTDGLTEVLSPYIKDGLVDLYLIKGKRRQTDAYNDVVRRYKRKIRYIATIDADEFILPLSSVDIKEKLETALSTPNVGGIAVNWACFGSSGHIEKPDGLVIENYLHRANDDFEKNTRIKSIVNPRRVAFYEHAHFPVYKSGYYAVNFSMEKVNGAISAAPDYTVARINHYMTKSKEEFVAKRLRGRAFSKNLRPENDFNLYDRNEVFDDSMLTHAIAIKKCAEQQL